MKKKHELKQTPGKEFSSGIENLKAPGNWKIAGILFFILLISFLVYLPVWHGQFLNWDDDHYIRENPLITSLNLKDIFTTNVASNYHPLTILCLAIEYQFFKLNPTGYHVFNLFLHLLNTLLVFQVINKLSKNQLIALVAALLFGIHPIHAESVAWAAELKDLLYTFFFLLSYLFYLKYIAEQKTSFYVFALLLFLLSLLSKAMAASLPVVFILTDFYLDRKFTIRTVLEKIPFFILALILGIVAVIAQKSTGATEMIVFPFVERIPFASYAYIHYLYKLVFPFQLCAYYPYPIRPGAELPVIYYAYVFLVIALAILLFYSLRYSKKLFFAFGFFTITVFLVLQLLPVGGAIMADRYSYIPSIGIFYLAGEGIQFLFDKKLKNAAILLLAVFVIFFSFKAYERSTIWNNSFSLWNDVIKQYQNVPPAYNNRGLIYRSDKKPKLAIEDFSKAIALDTTYFESYINRGNAYRDINKFDEALADYNRAIELKPNFFKAYINRGILFLGNKRNDEALADFNRTAQLKPEFSESYYHIGLVNYETKNYDEAIKNYNKALQLRPSYAEAFYSRGVSEYYSGQNGVACSDLKKAAGLGYQVPSEVMKLICK